MESAKTPAGAAGQVRPRKSEAMRRLSASPAESEAPGTEINGLILEANLKRGCPKVYTFWDILFLSTETLMSQPHFDENWHQNTLFIALHHF